MAQAASNPITRRRLVAGAAALVPAAIAAPALAIPQDAALLGLCAEAHALVAELAAATARYSEAEQRFWAWEAKNPEPLRRAHVCTEGDPNTDLFAARREHEIAMTAWRDRQRAAYKACGVDAASKAESFIEIRLTELCERIACTPTKSIEGLRAKASLHHHHDDMLTAIADDLLEITTT